MLWKKILAFALLTVLMLGVVASGTAEINRSSHPLVDAQSLVRARGGDEVINVLLLGNEFGTAGQGKPSASGAKQAKGIGLLAYHTDAVMVLSVNKTQGKVNLLSIPRDTLVYVPGVYGIYKLNAAFNCATTVKEGIRHARDAVSWLLGGVKIDYYVFVDMAAVVTLGDLLGGVDFEVERGYTGTSGIRYKAGLQHLDGMGIMDYVRARKNIDGSDLNRTERGRKIISAIMLKLWDNKDLANTLWNAAEKSSVNFYTDLESGDLLALYEAVQGLSSREIGSMVLDGRYGTNTACGDYQFRIVDEENRKQIIREAFGLDAAPLEYASLSFVQWVFRGNGIVTPGEQVTGNRYSRDGFDFVKYLHKGQQTLETAYSIKKPTDGQKNAVDAFEAAYNEFLTAFEDAASRASRGDRSATISNELVKRYEKALGNLCDALGVERVKYTHGYFWEQDPCINQYANIDWR